MKITITAEELSKDPKLLKTVINWMNYYVNDINSYNELTIYEKKILNSKDFKKLTVIPTREWK